MGQRLEYNKTAEVLRLDVRTPAVLVVEEITAASSVTGFVPLSDVFLRPRWTRHLW